MKIALVIPHEMETEDTFIPSGIYRYTIGLANALNRRGHTVWLLSKVADAKRAKNGYSEGIFYGSFVVQDSSRFSFAEQVHEFCLAENVDVIEAHQSQFPLFLEQILGKTATVTRYASGFVDSILSGDFRFDEVAPPVSQMPMNVSPKDLVWTEHLCEQITVRNSSLVLCASVKMAHRAHELGCKNIHVVPLGIDKVEEKYLSSTDSRTILISVVRFNDSRKGGDLVESIIRNLPREYPIVVLGEMTEEHNSLKGRLLAMGATVIDKPISQEELKNIYRQSQYCIVPTLSESFGYNLLEPLSHGVPTICFDQDDPSKKDWPLLYMGNYRTCNLKDSLARIFNSLDSNYRMIQTSGFEFSKQFEWDNIIEKYEACYRSAMCSNLLKTGNIRGNR